MASTIVPFSADVLLIGLLVAGGDPIISFICATAGNWLGGLTSYAIGWLGKWEWIEKWFRVTREKLESHKHRIEKYGSLLAFLSWLPFVGDIFSIGLGFYKVRFATCSLYMLIGRAARFFVWILLFEQYGDFLHILPE